MPGPRTPMAEGADLKSVQCRFKSDRGHQWCTAHLLEAEIESRNKLEDAFRRALGPSVISQWRAAREQFVLSGNSDDLARMLSYVRLDVEGYDD